MSWYKKNESDSDDESTTNDIEKKKGAKILRYFLLILWLQRLYMTPESTAVMRWHADSYTKDGFMRHPADSPTWKTIDHTYPNFARELRNVRLGLASDGFNPFGNMNVSHSIWPVVLMPYNNLPPWMCMKKPYLFLTLLIPGPLAPGNNIDVYLQPLIEELKELWETGVETYDASTKNTFNMRARLLWTINDFPAYANLSGWSTKEFEIKPRGLIGEQVLGQLQGIREFKCHAYRKNVYDSVLGTLLNLDGKTKDHLKSRRDLEEMKIRSELHPTPLPNGKVYLPPACFTMDKKKKELFCEVLMGVKVLDGYSANISRCVQQKPPKLSGLKSHDNHILMQYLLPVAVQNVLPKKVRSVVMNLCRYYRQLCSKVLNPYDLVQMENDIGKILSELEMIFPPSFFDIMIHLSVHLATEAKHGGPVHYRWMYPIERYLGTLKSYVRNKAKPEGSIAKGYLAEECLAFCSLYLSSDVETIHIKKSRNYDDGGKEDVLPIFSMPGRPIGAAVVTHLDKIGDNIITDDLRHLANGPCEFVKTYKGFIVNGYRFHIKDVERKRKTQNSGVILEALTKSFSSTRDNNPVTGDVTYYGVIKEIIELQYSVENKIVLFHCDWISNGSRKKVDENGFTLLNFVGVKPDKEPNILASQAQQVFYVKDRVHKGWKIVIKTMPRDSYDMDEKTNVDIEMLLQSATSTGPDKDVDVDIEMVRRDLEGTVVEKYYLTN
ncbi:uncharacterized protein [Rutidosis leptorrhynchoides]|uniref:uncharacterized protein n=1 Tax=Rutidosis leptorrhynchoides TaxID=125765 RepID=UPI003A9A0696